MNKGNLPSGVIFNVFTLRNCQSSPKTKEEFLSDCKITSTIFLQIQANVCLHGSILLYPILDDKIRIRQISYFFFVEIAIYLLGRKCYILFALSPYIPP